MVVAMMVLLVGCGSSSTTKSGSPTTSPGSSPITSPVSSPTTTPASETIRAATDAKLGQIVVDAQGMTLYRNTKEVGGVVACSDACVAVWPPLTVGAGVSPTGAGLTGKLATTTRPDGSIQVTYDGQPLYRYTKDTKSGDTTGQGVGGIWFVVAATGAATGGGAGAGSSPSTTSSGGY